MRKNALLRQRTLAENALYAKNYNTYARILRSLAAPGLYGHVADALRRLESCTDPEAALLAEGKLDAATDLLIDLGLAPLYSHI